MNSTSTRNIEITIELENGDQNYYGFNKEYDNTVGCLLDSYFSELDIELDYSAIESITITADDTINAFVKIRDPQEWEGSYEDLGEIDGSEFPEVAEIRANAQTTTQGVEKGERDLTAADARR